MSPRPCPVKFNAVSVQESSWAWGPAPVCLTASAKFEFDSFLLLQPQLVKYLNLILLSLAAAILSTACFCKRWTKLKFEERNLRMGRNMHTQFHGLL